MIARYSRQTLIEGWDQEKLSNAKIVMVGAGALGNYVSLGLVGLGIGALTIIDKDVLERSNMNRQLLFTEKDIGRQKVSALAERLRERNSTTVVTSINEKITGNNLAALIGTCDILIDAVDNIPTRLLLSRYALIKGIPLVHGATSHNGGQMCVITRNTPCYECFTNIERHLTPSQNQSCTALPVPSVGYVNQIIAGLMVENVRILLNPHKGESIIEPILYYDLQYPQRFYSCAIQRKEQCSCREILITLEDMKL
ncbi:MAG: ThiF family adenylyltransferase [Candidatus Heimdallarchaeota archaeon]